MTDQQEQHHPEHEEVAQSTGLTMEERRALRRYLLTVEYLGPAFAGCQRQPQGVVTVQGALEEALKQLIKQA